MKPSELTKLLETAFNRKRKVLIKGKPGIGKSEIVEQAASLAGADLIISHPAISDPTDYKGMPAIVESGAAATFLPFGDLVKLINATKLTICFQDDIGQASPAVQAALMQLNQARRVNGHKISDHVVFCGATNDTKHMAGVMGMIEPLKSRWDTIVELDTDIDDWTLWALGHDMPPELVAFLRFRPALLSDFKPTRELTNSPCPRTWACVGRWLNDGVKNRDVFTGAVGEGATTEFWSFLDMFSQLPNVDGILMDPDGATVPDKPNALYAVTSALARKATPNNFERVLRYLVRLPKEFEVCCVRDSFRLTPAVQMTRAYVEWSVRNKDVLM